MFENLSEHLEEEHQKSLNELAKKVASMLGNKTPETAADKLDQLIAKAEEEQKEYKKWLLVQPAEKILDYAFEYSLREDFLNLLEEGSFEDYPVEIYALLSSETPLANMVERFENRDGTDYAHVLETVFFEAAEEKIIPCRK